MQKNFSATIFTAFALAACSSAPKPAPPAAEVSFRDFQDLGRHRMPLAYKGEKEEVLTAQLKDLKKRNVMAFDFPVLNDAATYVITSSSFEGPGCGGAEATTWISNIDASPTASGSHDSVTVGSPFTVPAGQRSRLAARLDTAEGCKAARWKLAVQGEKRDPEYTRLLREAKNDNVGVVEAERRGSLESWLVSFTPEKRGSQATREFLALSGTCRAPVEAEIEAKDLPGNQACARACEPVPGEKPAGPGACPKDCSYGPPFLIACDEASGRVLLGVANKRTFGVYHYREAPLSLYFLQGGKISSAGKFAGGYEVMDARFEKSQVQLLDREQAPLAAITAK